MSKQPIRVGDKFQTSNGLVLEVIDVGFGDVRICKCVQPNGVIGFPQYRVSELQQKQRVA